MSRAKSVVLGAVGELGVGTHSPEMVAMSKPRKSAVIGAAIEAGVEMYSPGTIAKRLGMGKRTFFRWLSEGKFPPADLKVSPKLPRWRRETLERWVAENSER